MTPPLHQIQYAPATKRKFHWRRISILLCLGLIVAIFFYPGPRLLKFIWSVASTTSLVNNLASYSPPPGQVAYDSATPLVRVTTTIQLPQGTYLLFSHNRSVGNINDQLVLVYLLTPPISDPPILSITGGNHPQSIPTGRVLPNCKHLRIFAGQYDPADDSHFTIAYDADGKNSTIDGWLKNNGTVTLQDRLSFTANSPN